MTNGPRVPDSGKMPVGTSMQDGSIIFETDTGREAAVVRKSDPNWVRRQETSTYRVLPTELPDLRDYLLRQWQTGGLFDFAVKNGFIRQYSMTGDAANYGRGQRVVLQNASLWWVSADMQHLLRAAAPTLPSDVLGSELTAPSNFGLVVFEEPLMGHDSINEDAVFPVHALLWGQVRLGPLPDKNVSDVECWSIESYQWQEPMVNVETHTEHAGSWITLGKSDWPLAHRLDDAPFKLNHPALLSFQEDRRWLAALFTLLSQEGIAATETHYAPRQVRRRTERAGAKESDVKIVRLRRIKHTKPDDGETHAVDWKNQWMVDGHMRWQPCGPGRKERRLVYIAPYIKGPEDKPLKIKEKVNVWVR